MKRRRVERFYAVKIGRETGIFNDWETAKSQIIGYSGCLFKKFGSKEEARGWLESGNKRMRTEKEEKEDGSIIDVHVDGNHYKGTSSMGYGIYCRHEDNDYTLQERVNVEHMRSFFGVSEDALKEKFSNPTMELAAAIHVLILLCKEEKRKNFDLIRIHADYMGVKEWMEGTWKARKPIIKDLVRIGLEKMREVSSRDIEVQFLWVKGHNGNEGNEKADILAKGMTLKKKTLPIQTLFSQ